MKVLLLSLYHPEIVRGGAQQVCYDLFRAFDAMEGVEPTLLAAIDPTLSHLYKTGATITGFDGQDRQFLYLSQNYDYKWHKTSDSRAIDGLSEFFRITDPDVVHIHHFLLFGIDVISLVKRVLPSSKIVFTFHEFMAICHADGHLLRRLDGSNCFRPSIVRCNQCFPELPQSYFFMRDHWFKAHLLKADLMTAPSEFMIDHYLAFGIPRERLTCIPNGLRDSATETEPSPTASTATTFGFFGQLVDVKGVGLLLDAAEILHNEGFTHFKIEINGGNLRFASEPLRGRVLEAMNPETASSDMRETVVFNGEYSQHDLDARMRRVDWCVIPSLWAEAFCLVLSEAWARGRPPIAAHIGALGERITHNENGLLVPPGDAKALAQAIRYAATTPALRDRLRQNIKPYLRTVDSALLYLTEYGNLLTPPNDGAPSFGAATWESLFET